MATVQTKTPLTTAARFKTFMKNEMKCDDAVITGLTKYQGINELDEFKGMEETDWYTVAKQLLSPPDTVTGGVSSKTSPIIITAVSLKRLKAASITVRYYYSCGYDLTVENMRWPLIEEVSAVLKSLNDRKEKSLDMKLTKLSKNGEFPMWLEKNLIQLDSFIGNRGIPLSYLIRDEETPPAAPDLLKGKPYCEAHGSVEMVLIERATFDDPLYTQDDRMLFDKLAAAWSGTELDTCITAQMQRLKKGRALYLQSVKEFASKDKWMEIVTKCEDTLNNSKFHGTGNKYSMNMHISRHRVAFSKMEVAARQGKVKFSLPDETTRVRRLIKSMEDCTNQKLISRIENVLSDDAPTGKTITLIYVCSIYCLPVPYTPVVRKMTRAMGTKEEKCIGVITQS